MNNLIYTDVRIQDNSTCQFIGDLAEKVLADQQPGPPCGQPAVKTLRGMPLCQTHFDQVVAVFREKAKTNPAIALLCQKMGIAEKTDAS